jgi:transcriptional regulator
VYIRPSHLPLNESDVDDVIARNMFATLLNSGPSGIIASHLPFVREKRDDGRSVLFAHMARANPHAAIVAQSECLVIFAGPHAYISPSWYEDRATAPTWDYISIHCYGHARTHSLDETRQNIERLLEVVEADNPRGWKTAELPDAEVRRMLENVVSFEIEVTRIEAKFKLNQGEKPERTRAAIERLDQQGHEILAHYMRRYNGLGQ